MVELEPYPLLLRHVMLPAISTLTRYKITDHLRHQTAVEDWSLERLQRLQFDKLRAVVAHACESTRFYERRFREAGLSASNLPEESPLALLLPTTKSDVMRNFPDGITAQAMDRSQWRFMATSGTSRQVFGVQDLRKANINRAAGLRKLALANPRAIGRRCLRIAPLMCVDRCGRVPGEAALFSKSLFRHAAHGDVARIGQHIQEYLETRRQAIWRRITLPPFGHEGTNGPPEQLECYVRAIRQQRPYVLEALPLYLHMLAKYVLARNIKLPAVPMIVPYGGSMTQVMRSAIQQAFGGRVHDQFGCAELGDAGCECTLHDGIHCFMDLFYLEFFRRGRPAAPGELGRLYITDLDNRAMPFIRYDIGDVGRYYMDDHGCGRQAMRFLPEGRLEEVIVNSAGRAFSSDEVYDFMHSQPEVDNFQLIEKPRGNFELLCVPRPGQEVRPESLARRFGEFFDERAEVRTFVVKTIKSEEGGKFSFVKSSSWDAL